MLERYLRFVRAVSVNPLGRLGVVLTTSSFAIFIIMEAARLLGLVRNAYVGLIVYLLFPSLFVLGLILIPLAWARLKRRTGLDTRTLLEERFGREETSGRPTGAPVFKTVAILTLVNVLFLGAASVQMLHFMDRPSFCGTACHSVMNPEWVTYQASPHARVACVECHVGEGVGALVNSKLNGAWQMVSAAFNLYERPIPTPVHQLRPARETCETCHWPDKFYGNRVVTRVHYDDDRTSTPSYTTLVVKVDSGGPAHGGIHWHVEEANEVRYASVDDERERMLWVEVRRPDGTWNRYTNRDLEPAGDEHEEVRVLDCIDCHNRATHIYEDPERALDERITLGLVDRSLPFVKREALAALTTGWASVAAARDGITNHLHGYYRRHHPEVAGRRLGDIDRTVATLIDTWKRNIHPEMNIRWGSYPSQLGHRDTPGCFRCHSEKLVDDQGRTIDHDCTMCHSILAQGSPEPFTYLEVPAEKAPDRAMHHYLREEFLHTVREQEPPEEAPPPEIPKPGTPGGSRF